MSLFRIFVIILVIGAIYGIFNPDDEKSSSSNSSSSSNTSTSKDKPSKYGEIGDNDKYLICYGDMTALYKQTGFHKSNRSASIEAKETICRAYSRGEQSGYPKL